MKNFKSLPKKTKNLLNLGLIVFLVIVLPLLVWAIINLNFNQREKAATGEPSTPTPSSQILSSIGEQKVLVLLYNFQDNPSDKPFTKSEVQQTFFSEINSLNSIVKDLSYGDAWVTGDVVNWYTTPVSNIFNGQPNCSVSNGIQYAEANARANGVDVDSYSRRIYIHSFVPSCGGGASGSTGGNYLTTIISNGSIDKFLIAHELLHNFVVGHSHLLRCGENQIDTYSKCTVLNYGDYYSLMGSGIIDKNIPIYQKNYINWVADEDVKEVLETGTYTLMPSGQSTGIRSLKIKKVDTNEYYYLDFNPQYGTFIRIGFLSPAFIDNADSYTPETKLIDLTPDTQLQSDISLQGDRIFEDKINRIKISSISSNENQAIINIEFTDSIPTTSPTPTSSSSPSPSPTPKIGDVNNDGHVNLIDIGMVIDEYDKTNPSNPRVDVNGNGKVDLIDIGLIIDNYEW